MTIPGFTAETTVPRPSGQYRRPRTGPQRGSGGIVPQAYRGGYRKSLCDLECRGVCLNQCRHDSGSNRCRICRADCLQDCAGGIYG